MLATLLRFFAGKVQTLRNPVELLVMYYFLDLFLLSELRTDVVCG